MRGMDAYDWTDETGAWRAHRGDETVFELIPREDPRKRSAASAIGSGRDPLPAATRELLRLAAENTDLGAGADLLYDALVAVYALLAPSDGVPAANEDLITACLVRVEQAQERERLLAEEVERLKAEPDFVALVARAVRDERARIRRELEAEVKAVAGRPLEHSGEYAQGRDHERDFFEDCILGALDRIVPGEG